MLKRIVDFEVAPPPARETRGLVALGASAVLHAVIILLLIFGIPVSGAASLTQVPPPETSQPIALQPPPDKANPLPKLQQRPKPETPQPPPPPPMKEVELGPDSKRPDAPAKEAAAKKAEPDPAPAKEPDPVPVAEPPKPAEPQPVAPQRIHVPTPGEFNNPGRILMPTTSPFAPPRLDTASGTPAVNPPAHVTSSAMGRSGFSNSDPRKWENSFDDETAGRCVDIPDLGKNPDGSPVLASVTGFVFDTDGRTPLAGAHLQIVGTRFGTFSDNNGEYRLPFDPKMLEKCRKQYVDVVAPGYRGAQLTLMIGPRVRSDDVVLRKH